MVELLLWGVPLAGALQLALMKDNLKVFQAELPGPEPAGRVSVLIPARDEVARIGGCVRAVLAQGGLDEVLVLDDGSTDGTAAAARQEDATGRLRVLAGAPPPSGWVGKSYACWQLAGQARGDWLLFVDADVELAPGAVEAALRRAEATGADLLSFWPRQTLGTAGERLTMPLLDLVLLGFLPMRLAARRPDPALAAANGQCLLFRAESYRKAGGHAAVRADLVEDVALARAMKRAGGRVVLTDAGPLASVRMYQGLAEVWAGFRKNLYPAFGGRPGPFIAGLGLFAVLHALPPWLALAALGLGHPAWALPCGIQVLVAMAMRALLAGRLGHPALSVLAHPLAAGWLVALGLASWRAAARGAITWKGRTYALEPHT